MRAETAINSRPLDVLRLDREPELSLPINDALDGLKVIDTYDFPDYRAALAEGRPDGWSYYFPFLLTQNREGRSALLLDYDEGSVCLYYWRSLETGPRLDVHSAPVPMNPRVLKRCFERANDYNHDRSARCRRIDAKDVELVSRLPNIRTRKRKSQYLFAPSKYLDLGGKQLYTVRRQVKKVSCLPDVEVRPFTRTDAEGCHSLLKRWRAIHRTTHGGAGGFGMARRTIELVGQLPPDVLWGQVVTNGEELCGFAFGGELRPGLACSFERKCDNAVSGLSYFQLRNLMLSLQDYELVNDGSDAGREGLRQLKDSFRPIRMHTEYSAAQV